MEAPRSVELLLPYSSQGCGQFVPPDRARLTLKVIPSQSPDTMQEVVLQGDRAGFYALAAAIIATVESPISGYHLHIDEAANSPVFRSPQGFTLTIERFEKHRLPRMNENAGAAIGHSAASPTTSPVLRLLVLKTRQLESVRAFYALIGIEFAAETHGSGPEHYAGRSGEVVLELYPLCKDQTPVDTTLRLGLTVTNLNGVVESLVAAGARIARPPADSEWGRRAVVVDPDGRSVELYAVSSVSRD